MDRWLTQGEGEKPLIGVNEVIAIGAGAVALWRIRNRRKKAREEAERVRRAEDQQGKNGDSTQRE